MNQKTSQLRITQLLQEIRPLTNHNEIYVYPAAYEPDTDTLFLEIAPRSAQNWSEVAYKFGKQRDMKYDRDSGVYGIDGQPRVSYSGQVWVRFIGDFFDGSKVALHIFSQQPSHREAEEQLSRFYGLWEERDGLNPIEVFIRKLC